MCVAMVAVVMVRGWDGDEENHCCAAVVMDISQHLVSVIAARPGTGLLSGCQLTSGVWCLAGAWWDGDPHLNDHNKF